MATYQPENSQENSKKSTKKINRSEKINSPLTTKKTLIFVQWDKYSKTKEHSKTSHESYIGQTTVKHAQNTNNAVEKGLID